MRKLSVLAIFLAAACAQQREEQGDAGTNRAVDVPSPPPVQTATLTGLYESAGPGPGQLCITEQGGTARFGLVTRSSGVAQCSGAGTATLRGTTLRLAMNGESACTIEARMEGRRLTFPAELPRGCAYYCSPGGGLGTPPFEKVGGAREDALRARDLAGGPLCT